MVTLDEDESKNFEDRGYSLIEQGRLDDASECFASLISSASHDGRGYAGLAYIAEQKWQWKEAIFYWDQYLKTSSHELEPQAVVRKGCCLVETGQIEIAKQVLSSIGDQIEGVVGLADISAIYEPQEVCLQKWEKCIARFPERIEGFLGKANYFLSRNDCRNTEILLLDVLSKWPTSLHAKILRAKCMTSAKNWETAGEHWRDLIGNHPDNMDIQRGYIRYLAYTSDHSAFLDHLTTLIERPAARAEILVEYHLARDDFGAAVEEAKKLLELKPLVFRFHLQYAIVLMREGSGDTLHAALWVLRNLIRQSPDSTEVKVQLIEAYIRSGLTSAASTLIESLPSEDVRTSVEILRAWLEHLKNDEPAAKDRWKKILERCYVPAVHASVPNPTRLDKRHISIHPDDILLFSVIRNEMPRLEWFLSYYRNLGVRWFIIVDNGSNDSTRQILSKQSDVILYSTNDSYSAAASGMKWVNDLIECHGKKNWCLHVDADEAFMFPGQEDMGLTGFVKYLRWKGYDAVPATMLDMYPAVLPTISIPSTNGWLANYIFFDRSLQIYDVSVCPYREIYGGIRRRLFRGYHLMNKVPLINGASGLKYLLGSHRISPARISDVTGVLLHYHLVYMLNPEYRETFNDAISRREFPSNSLERSRALEILEKLSSKNPLRCEDSVVFESMRQLLNLGLVKADKKYLEFCSASAIAKTSIASII